MANLRLPIDIGPITDGLRDITQSLRAVVDSVSTLPQVAESLRAVVDSVSTLPQVAEALEEIRKSTTTMADEVHRMRVGVDELGEEVRGMRSAVEPLVPHMDVVAARIEALEPRLEDLSLALHPMRRLTRRRGANGFVAPEDEVAEEATEQAAIADGIAQTESGENVSQSDGLPEE